MMMNIMVKTAGKALEKKTDRTPEEEDMLDMMLHGGERVRIQNLQGVISWYETLFWKYGNYSNDYYDNCSSWIYWIFCMES